MILTKLRGNQSPKLTIPQDRHLDGCSVLADAMKLKQEGKRFIQRFQQTLSLRALYRRGLPRKECGCDSCKKNFSE
jgi:hypothetical protein